MSTDTYSEMQMNQASIEFVLAHLVRDETVLLVGRQGLDPKVFDSLTEAVYQTIWTATLGYYDEHQKLPDYSWLSMMTISRLTGKRGITDSTLKEADDILRWIFSPEHDKPNTAAAIVLLRQLLLDRNVKSKMFAAATQYDINPSEVPMLVESLNSEVQSITSLGHVMDGSPFPASWDMMKNPKHPFGVALLDTPMGGGTFIPETHVLLGPSGVGKTTLAMQVACATAKREYDKEHNNPECKGGLVLYV